MEVREFSKSRPVPADVKSKILEAARLTGSSMNTQHWRFIIVQENLKQLADDSRTGAWVAGCDFAVIILTNPKVPGHVIDGGRVLQDMQLAAWNVGVGSGIFTGVKEDKLRKDFAIPKELDVTAVAGFGYPARNVTGKKKNRKPLDEIAFNEKFGNKFDQKTGFR
ncbi:MAG: nitroreductase family protein [Thaumarchaeota archaeon]|nr:nitroreductase family protein [Nitrososphaerota archaeon]